MDDNRNDQQPAADAASAANSNFERRCRRARAAGAGGGARGRARRAQGQAAARAGRSREHPPPRPARARGRRQICDRRLCQGSALGRRQSAPRARQPARGRNRGRAHPQPARRGRRDRARAAGGLRAPRHPPHRSAGASRSTTIFIRRSSRPSAPASPPARSSRYCSPAMCCTTGCCGRRWSASPRAAGRRTGRWRWCRLPPGAPTQPVVAAGSAYITQRQSGDG